MDDFKFNIPGTPKRYYDAKKNSDGSSDGYIVYLSQIKELAIVQNKYFDTILANHGDINAAINKCNYLINEFFNDIPKEAKDEILNSLDKMANDLKSEQHNNKEKTEYKVTTQKSTSISAGKVLSLITIVVFIFSVVIGFKDFMVGFLILVSSILVYILGKKISNEVGCVLVILSCGGVLLYANSSSSTAVMGEKYSERAQYEEILNRDRQKTYSDMAKVSQSEKAVKANLKDPGSAKFTNSFIGKSGATCGYVNAKNSFGGYSGDKQYINIGQITSIDDGSANFAQLWRDFCR